MPHFKGGHLSVKWLTWSSPQNGGKIIRLHQNCKACAPQITTQHTYILKSWIKRQLQQNP